MNYQPTDKILFSLEEFDSIIETNRPNGSSKSWYLNEIGKITPPLMWGEWNFFDEGGKFHNSKHFIKLTRPNYCDVMQFVTQEELKNRPHLYMINVQNPSFFILNRDIGFGCVSEKYLNDVRKGKCKIVIMMIFEGYSGGFNNFDFEIIEGWRKKSFLPEYSVYFINGNLLSDEIPHKKGLKINARGVHNFEPWNEYYGPIVEFNPIDDEYLFLSYNRQPRPHRIKLLVELLRKNLVYKGKVSFRKIERRHIFSATEEEADYIIENSPFSIDSNLDLNHNHAINLNKKNHENTFISVVTETLSESGILFLSEKIWKPILLGHPFMVLGSKGTLNYLKSLGYKTFDKWVDESYDDIDDSDDRCVKIVTELKKFENKSIDNLKEIRKEMVEICQHNQNHFKVLYEKNYNKNQYSHKIESIFKEIWEETIDFTEKLI
jgi:hypothetical protein